MTFEDIALDALTLRAVERLEGQLVALADEVMEGREHWSTCFALTLRVYRTQRDADPSLQRLEDVVTELDRDALAKVQPDLDRLLSAVWHHGQWKLGELAAWQRVWLHLRSMHEQMTRGDA